MPYFVDSTRGAFDEKQKEGLWAFGLHQALQGPKIVHECKKYSCWIQKWAQKFTLSWKWAQAQNWATNQAWSIKWVENEALKISQLPRIYHIEKEPKIQAVPKPQKAEEPKRNEMAPSWSIYAFSLLLEGSRHLSCQRTSWWCSLPMDNWPISTPHNNIVSSN